MNRIRSGDAEIAYEVLGSGPPVVLLHPFPVHHELWIPAAQALALRYRVILPDLRGHGESDVGEGPATMQKHAADIARVLDDAEVPRAVFAGNSIGGYVLFEFWRQYAPRVLGLALCNTQAKGETSASRASRLQAAEDVLAHGVDAFAESMLPRVLGKTTATSRPDLVEGARRMMLKMSPADVAEVQRGMADRPDSVATLSTIRVPTVLITGDEDASTGVPAAQSMQRLIPGSQMMVVPKAGHYSPWEQPEDVGLILRQFVDRIYHA